MEPDDVLAYLRVRCAMRWSFPTMRVIADQLELGSTRTAHRYVTELEEAGKLIRLDAGRALFPTYQTRRGYPNGNCWEACVATVTGIPLEEVPDGRPSAGRADWTEVHRWLAGRGWSLTWWTLYPDETRLPRQPCILGGTSRAGYGHAVVAVNGEVVHNPNTREDAELVTVNMYELITPMGGAPRGRDGTLLPYADSPSNEEMARL